jgi:DNA-binding PadR family transcriptional regulator
MSRKITYNGALVLQALAKDHRYGFEIMDFTGLASGTTYPILRRFERDGLVCSRWEAQRAAHDDGRPPRRYYELTSAGNDALVEALERFAAHQKVFAAEPSPGSTGGSIR